MGIRTNLGDEGAQYLHDNYKQQIDPHLDKVASILYELGASNKQIVACANRVADVSALAFKAGMEFAIKNELTD